MSIVIKTGSTSKTIFPKQFDNEKHLENFLAGHPELLDESGEQTIRFVSGQVNLPDAGRLDLLFVTSEGLPIAVEVKLERNGESRREVVAQAIDYLSSLTALTVDELDNLVSNQLDGALRGFAGEDEAEFDRIWSAVGGNLRAGKAKLVVALDKAPLPLERIFRFLARNSDLDVQLLTVQLHADPDGSEILVPRLLVNPASEDKPGRAAAPVVRKTIEELLAKCENQAALSFFKQRCNRPTNSQKNALAYRQADKFHWFVTPSPTGAFVIQIDRFNEDETTWSGGLSNPNIKRLRYDTNLRFDLTSPSDFEFFAKIAETGSPLSWLKKLPADEAAASPNNPASIAVQNGE